MTPIRDRQIRVYTASKTSHAEMWVKLREEWPEIHFTARWPMQVKVGLVETPASAAQFWQDDLEDVKWADVVLVYAESKPYGIAFTNEIHVNYDHLRDALVEAGMGIALGKTIIVVGDAPDYRIWQYHPLVRRVKDLEGARDMLAGLAGRATKAMTELMMMYMGKPTSYVRPSCDGFIKLKDSD